MLVLAFFPNPDWPWRLHCARSKGTSRYCHWTQKSGTQSSVYCVQYCTVMDCTELSLQPLSVIIHICCKIVTLHLMVYIKYKFNTLLKTRQESFLDFPIMTRQCMSVFKSTDFRVSSYKKNTTKSVCKWM